MVDAVVSFVLERLGDFLIQEAASLGRVREEVKWLQNELGWMQCYIANAEEKQKQFDNPLIRKWLSDITDISYDIEDVMDRFILQVHDETTTDSEYEDTRGKKPTGCFGSMSSCINKMSSFNPITKAKEQFNLYKLGKGIEVLKHRINDLSRKRELYGLQDSTDNREGKSNTTTLGRLKQLRRASSFVVEEKIVGFEDDAERLLARLLDREPRRSVVSIYGMGGLGKTTLARKLYHSHDVKMKFNCCAWVYVSQDYNNHDLLVRVINSFRISNMKTEQLKQMSEEDLERCLRELLQDRSYLVVIDDVWQKEAWESLKRAFPNNNNGSRVIITTRIKDVAVRSDERTHVHKLRFLRFDESWQLFSEKAFQKSDANDADAELKTLGMEMVQKCNGLPLAIIVLGGLLSTKSKPREWKMVREHIWQNLRNDSIHISCLLDLSFKDLSYQLKLCFLYLSLFPEDFEIDVEKLIQLWIAEGFIVPQNESQEVEDVAKDSFDELINRSLIQIEKKSWGKITTCRVHDLLRDLAIHKAKELKFVHIYDEMKHSTYNFSILLSCRREAIYLESKLFLWLQQSNSSLRSLLFFNPYRCQLEITWQLSQICTKLRFLRVLCVDGYNVQRNKNTLCEEIGKLIHLRYLGLRGSRFDRILPSSIFNLTRLQTFDVFTIHAQVELPDKIFALKELKHLSGLFHGPLCIDSLTKLQSLKYVHNESWSQINTAKLVNLRELCIYGKLPRGTTEFSFDSIAGLKRLEQLSVKLQFNGPFASLRPLHSCSRLTLLRLCGKIGKLPDDIHEILQNLECLILSGSLFRDDPMPQLEKLPCLMILYLGSGFYNGKKLICRAHGFPRLEVLKLVPNHKLEEWQVEDGAMPRLRGLTFPQDFKLKIPERLRSIPLPGKYEVEGHWFDEL